MSKQQGTVTILNPTPGGSSYTSLKRALHFIRLGRAEAVGKNAIQFIHHFHSKDCADAELRLARRRSGFEDTVMATLDQAQGLPLAGPAEKIFQTGAANFRPRAAARGKVRTIAISQ